MPSADVQRCNDNMILHDDAGYILPNSNTAAAVAVLKLSKEEKKLHHDQQTLILSVGEE